MAATPPPPAQGGPKPLTPKAEPPSQVSSRICIGSCESTVAGEGEVSNSGFPTPTPSILQIWSLNTPHAPQFFNLPEIEPDLAANVRQPSNTLSALDLQGHLQ